MILVFTLVSLNVSQSLMAETEFKKVQAEIVRDGVFPYTMGLAEVLPPGFGWATTTSLSGTTYTINYSRTTGTGPFGTDTLTFKVSY
jgi:hypothetical protein